jgi:hypothetical protein
MVTTADFAGRAARVNACGSRWPTVPRPSSSPLAWQALARIVSTGVGLALHFAGRRLLVFPEKPKPDWKPQGGG